MNTRGMICEMVIDNLDRMPMKEIKVSQVTRDAEISRSTFYFYFDSIESAVDAIEDDFISGISDEATAITRIHTSHKNSIKTEKMIEPTVSYVDRNLKTFRVLSGPNGDPNFRKKLCDRIYYIYNALYTTIESENYRSALTCELMASAQWAIYSWWANHADEATEAEIINYISQFLKEMAPFFQSK